MMKLRPIA